MKYVSVTSPGSEMSRPIFNYFDDYLVSMGEPATSNAWNMTQVVRHVGKIIEEKPDNKNIKLFIDSGGFQIIVGYVSEERINEFIDTYHFILQKFYKKIDLIFALDVFALSFLPQERVFDDVKKEYKTIPVAVKNIDPDNETVKKMMAYNKYSMTSSIDLIKQYPEIADKQLFILQTSNLMTFSIWKKLFMELEVYKYYKRWSIGGLVGLKKSTNAKFSHAVPATLWLLTYQKHLDFTIDQVHWLGQSSRLSFLSMALFERIYNINMTSDSSQLVRFAPLSAKLPYIVEQDGEFRLISTVDEVKEHMIKKHSIKDALIYITRNARGKIKEYPEAKELPYLYEYSDELFQSHKDPKHTGFYLTPMQFFDATGKLDNQTFIELQSQNLYADLHFGNLIIDKVMEIGIDNITQIEQLKNLHPIMARGRTATELFNNIDYFKKFQPIIAQGDTDSADNILEEITKSYH